MAGLLEGVGAADTGAGLALYTSTIPYILYAWVAVLIVPLVGLGLVPDLGPMRRAEERMEAQADAPEEESVENARRVNFLVPLIVLIGAAWYLGDALAGVMIAVALTAVLLMGQRLLTFSELSESFFDGFKSMVYPLAILVMSFGLRNVNEDLGLTQFVIETVRPIMSGALLPSAIGSEPDRPGYSSAEARRTVIRAHGITKGVFAAAVNRVGVEGAMTFYGESFVSDPLASSSRGPARTKRCFTPTWSSTACASSESSSSSSGTAASTPINRSISRVVE